LAIYLLHTGAGFSQPVVAQALGILKQTVSQAVRTVEDRREDAGFDALCDRLLNEAGVCDE
jgi:biotin operon repressor